MATYTRDYSNYPNENYVPHEFRDVDNEVGAFVNQIKAYMVAGNYNEAQAEIARHPELEPYLLNTEHINMIEEELRNLEIYAKSRQQAVFYQEEKPGYMQVADVWLASDDLEVV